MSLLTTEELNTRLFLKTRENDAEGVMACLAQGASLLALNGGQSALSLAVDRGCEASARALIEAGASLSALPEEAESPVMTASKRGKISVACLRALLIAGADPNEESSSGVTPLGAAAFDNRFESALELLKGGADPDRAGSNYGTALGLCALFNHMETLNALISFKADVEKKDKGGWTPLMCACNTGNVEAAKALLAAGASPRTLCDKGETARKIACRNGYGELAILLAGLEARLEAKDLERGLPSAPRSSSSPRV